MQPGHQRRGARPGTHHQLPAAHAVLPRRRHHRRRTLAGRRLPRGARPRRGPRRLRPDHPVRRLRQRPHRLRARGARHPGAQGRRRQRLRARRVHRLRRLRGGVPQRLRDALHLREGQPPQRPAAGRARARDPGARHGRPDGRRGLRRLHPDRRVRHRLPQGHPAHLDHRHEQGVAARHPQGPQELSAGGSGDPHRTPSTATTGCGTPKSAPTGGRRRFAVAATAKSGCRPRRRPAVVGTSIAVDQGAMIMRGSVMPAQTGNPPYLEDMTSRAFAQPRHSRAHRRR
ncbi:hypothetical protein SCOCK_110159 [Actinacidiphila cocklensis]|uniref:Uncharacterized protein n=1 Tax=Actinacidiphila cocklensis TaxID=887465 RepID=A0A9W4GQ90_9ACTN|nr:hypothetical protein SCOCK_110159 [Actinacidiphila cocklensis]